MMNNSSKPVELAVDGDNKYGYKIGQRGFSKLEIQKVETCLICWLKVLIMSVEG